MRLPRTSQWCFAPSFATAVHLHVMFALHPSVPFYALAPALNVFASLLMFHDSRVLIAFTASVLVLSLLPLLLGGGPSVLFYAMGAASVLFLAYRRLVRAREEPASVAELHEVNDRYLQERSDRIRLQQELEAAQRMESVGRMAGSFAHQFNNQLMAIHIHSELLDQALPPDSPLRRDLRSVSAATNEAAELAAQLLAYSSGPKLREHHADLTQVLRASRVVLEHVMPTHTQVVVRLPDVPCPVAVSPERIEQVLLNLALNARDAMPEGGVFRVELARRKTGDLELPDSLQGSELVELVVSDTGVGIAPDAQASIFEPFYTTKDATAHNGLGLSVVYAIVSDSGGLVRLCSGEGQGARFEIYWPLHEPELRASRRWLPPAAIRRAESLLRLR